jgi:hypothetical protein
MLAAHSQSPADRLSSFTLALHNNCVKKRGRTLYIKAQEGEESGLKLERVCMSMQLEL